MRMDRGVLQTVSAGRVPRLRVTAVESARLSSPGRQQYSYDQLRSPDVAPCRSSVASLGATELGDPHGSRIAYVTSTAPAARASNPAGQTVPPSKSAPVTSAPSSVASWS